MVVPGTDWRSAAACRSYDPDLFFPLSRDGGATNRQLAMAKAVCARCLVRTECLDFALSTRQAYGVWGGMSEQELHLLRGPAARPADTDAGEWTKDLPRQTSPFTVGGVGHQGCESPVADISESRAKPRRDTS